MKSEGDWSGPKEQMYIGVLLASPVLGCSINLINFMKTLIGKLRLRKAKVKTTPVTKCNGHNTTMMHLEMNHKGVTGRGRGRLRKTQTTVSVREWLNFSKILLSGI